MAKSYYRKVNLGPSAPVTAKISYAGMMILADYLDPINNQRTLLLERVEQTGESEKPKQGRKSKRAADSDTTSSAA